MSILNILLIEALVGVAVLGITVAGILVWDGMGEQKDAV